MQQCYSAQDGVLEYLYRYANLGFSDPARDLFLSVDYAGLVDDAVGGALGTEFDGRVIERLLPDGRVEVTVELETEDANFFLVDGQDFAEGPLLLGQRVSAGDPPTIANPVLGECSFRLVFTNAAPGAPLPDLIQLLFFPDEGQELISTEFFAEGEGDEGEVETTQICLAPCAPDFVFTVEDVIFEAEDDDDDSDSDSD